jgi:hypothetical protein
MATILYARVSTIEQTIDHELAHPRSAGFVNVVSDNGVVVARLPADAT